jgi:hypothetical protein
MQNFRTIGQGVFVRRVPENRMFPEESEVVLNTVLSANALARDSGGLQNLNSFVWATIYRYRLATKYCKAPRRKALKTRDLIFAVS